MEWKYCYDCKHKKKKPNVKPCDTCMKDGVSNWEQGKTNKFLKEKLEEVIKR